MRILGIILVLFGALGLAYDCFKSVDQEQDETAVKTATQPEVSLRNPSIAGGVAVVSGLILLASGTRTELEKTDEPSK